MAEDIEHPPRGYTTEDVKQVPEKKPRRRYGGKFFLLSILLVPLIVFGLWTWIALGWAYSDGERVGYVQKFSRKGWLCKTWEGELALASIPGSMPELFHFTVRDDKVADKINASAGQRLALHYEQHKGVPTSCFGETEYYVKDLRVVGR
jgi:hypothetical protein